MSQHTSTRRTRLQVECLEDRCTPSAAAHVPAPPELAAALVAGHGQHAVPIQLSAHITSDGSGGLSLTGHGSHLGRWTGQGTVDRIVVDADQVTASATVTIVAANGDQLFVSVAASWNLSTSVGEETITFNGGTGRFAGASGGVSGECTATVDPASLVFECNSHGSGTLAFAHSS